jgi:hypothetical protein
MINVANVTGYYEVACATEIVSAITVCAVLRGPGGYYVSCSNRAEPIADYNGYDLLYTGSTVQAIGRWSTSAGYWTWLHGVDTTKEHTIIVSYRNQAASDDPSCWVDGVNVDASRVEVFTPAGTSRWLSHNKLFIGGAYETGARNGFNGSIGRVAFYRPVQGTTHRIFTDSEAKRWHRTKGYPANVLWTQDSGGSLACRGIYDPAGLEGATASSTLRNIYRGGDLARYPDLTRVGTSFNYGKPYRAVAPRPIATVRG